MAIAHLQPSGGIATNAVDHGFSRFLRRGSNRALVVCCTWEEGADDTYTVNSVKFGGQTLTKNVSAKTTGTGIQSASEIWTLKEADLPTQSGSHEIAVDGTYTGVGVLYMVTYAMFFEGVDQDVFVESTSSVEETTPVDDTIENTVSPSQNSWVISSYNCGNAGTGWNVNAGQVEMVDYADATSRHGVAVLQGATGETNLSSTFLATANRMVRTTISLKADDFGMAMVV